jgi:hypothetical protein
MNAFLCREVNVAVRGVEKGWAWRMLCAEAEKAGGGERISRSEEREYGPSPESWFELTSRKVQFRSRREL